MINRIFGKITILQWKFSTWELLLILLKRPGSNETYSMCRLFHSKVLKEYQNADALLLTALTGKRIWKNLVSFIQK